MKCENYREIILLNVAYKKLSSIKLGQLKEYSKEILREYQCGFKPQRETTDQIFVIRQILENFLGMILIFTSSSLILKTLLAALTKNSYWNH